MFIFFCKENCLLANLHGNIKSYFFSNLHGNIKLQVFPKLKLYVESPKVMVNKCVVTSCSTGYKTGQKKT